MTSECVRKQRAAAAKHSSGAKPPGVEVGAGSHEHFEAVVVPLLDLRALAQSPQRHVRPRVAGRQKGADAMLHRHTRWEAELTTRGSAVESSNPDCALTSAPFSQRHLA